MKRNKIVSKFATIKIKEIVEVMHMLDDMLLFVSVVELRSFSKAALNLGITKSVVSKRITRLEKKLGAQLITRTTRKLFLTEIGCDFYKRCRTVQENLDEAVNVVRSKQQTPLGTLKISIPQSFGLYVLLPIIFDFIRNYPQVSLQCNIQPTPHWEENNEFDLIIVSAKNLPDSNYQAKLLSRNHGLQVCASSKYLKEHGVPKIPQDLVTHNCLICGFPDGRFDRWQFNNKGKEEFVSVQGNYQVNSPIGLLEAALAGIGITALAGFIVKPYIEKGKLVSLLDKYCQKNTNFYALYHKNRYLTPKVRLFIDTISQALEK